MNQVLDRDLIRGGNRRRSRNALSQLLRGLYRDARNLVQMEFV
jgi:hypothetical protein